MGDPMREQPIPSIEQVLKKQGPCLSSSIAKVLTELPALVTTMPAS